jgi:hypothetical protein
MTITNIANGLWGFGLGYNYTTFKAKEDEIRQGGNHAMAALPQVMEVGIVASQVSRMCNSTTASICLFFAPMVGSIPIGLMGAVRGGYYDKIAEFCSCIFPKELGSWTFTVINFVSEHLGTICGIAIVILSAAQIAVGDYVFGATVIVGIAYQVVDHRLGLVPRSLSLLLETYLPMLSMLGVLIAGEGIICLYAFFNLLCYWETAAQFTFCQIDAALRWITGLKGPTVREIQSPVVENKQLSFDEMKQILNGNNLNFELNPSHCVRATISCADIAENRNFDELKALFDKIVWDDKGKNPLIKNKLKDDDRFIDYLMVEVGMDGKAHEMATHEGISSKLPHLKEGDYAAWLTSMIKKDFDLYLNKVASKHGKSSEEFATAWFKEQMKGLVEGLTGRRRVEGTQQDLDDAIQNCAKILTYLQSLDPKKQEDLREIEDTLLALTVEGGMYCARGVKRISRDLLRQIFFKNNPESHDPVRDYELKVSQSLETIREGIIEEVYKEITKMVKIPDAIASDVHGFDIYRRFLSMPFFPMTNNEKFNIGFPEMITLWQWTCAGIYEEMYETYEYRLDEAIKEQGEVHFSGYMRQVIDANDQLEDTQKEQLIEMLWNEDAWDKDVLNDWSDVAKQINQRFHRLMFVMQGVLRPKA